jgi:Leucine-rich repeat (LRR) protein/GTPase SAR1 family protein
MARNEAYRIAEQKIEEALRSGATQLDLSARFVAKDDKLTELPDSLAQLTQLQQLYLRNNQLTALPDSLAQLTQLQLLDLQNNQLTALPDSLAQLTQLQLLDLSNNQLTALPDSLAQLTQLQHLYLSSNQLTALPDSLAQLTQLQELYLSNNQLTALPDSLAQLTQLQHLRLSYNQLTALPDSLAQLTQLQQLYLNNNQLTALPDSLAQLTQLQQLSLDGNQLTALPDSLAQLTQLQQLYLRNNQLTALPDSLAQLTTLKRLFVNGNQLRDLPGSFAQLKHLEALDLDDNPLNPELAAAYEYGIDAVKRYLRAKAEDQIVLNEAKLILVGEGEVGKSCLLAALRGEAWQDRVSTHGIEIKQVKVFDATGKEITLNAWDFGGQRVYRPTHQLFFSAPAVYLVVWKPREGPQQGFVKEWIQLVKHREPDAKILVVATHGGPKDRKPDIDRQEIWDLFGKDTVIDFFYVDSKPTSGDTGTYTGIDELKDAIAKVAASLPEVGREVPKKWQEVREALKQTGEAYLPLDRVLEICGKHQMPEEEAQAFVRISHRLGHLIHYGHDPRLKDIVILKPDWLATAVSFVLDDQETRDKHGLVKFTRLGKLWSDNERESEFRYPPKVNPMFVALMERFDLSYRVAGSPLGGESDETTLIAQLVPDVRPETDIAREWKVESHPEDEQQVQICKIVDQKGQSAAAEGLFYQLIVRLHKFSLGRKDFSASVHWQRGLILDDDYNGRALLEHDGNDVRITVRAAYPGNFLAVLTHEVKWLVDTFWEGLKCEVVVPCIEPCGRDSPGTGLYEVEKLIKSKRRLEYPCPVCNEWQEIDCLLRNAPAGRRPSIESLLTEGFGDMRFRLDELRLQNLVLDQNLKRIMSQVEDAFRGVMQTLADEGKDGPRLFSLVPVDRSSFNPNGWAKKKFCVTLWCEHTSLPLPLLNHNDAEGVYEFEVTREWFAKAAPFLKLLTGTLSLVLPVVASATKLALDETIYKGIEKQLDLGKSCAEAMLKSTEKTADWLSEKEGFGSEQTGYIRAHGGVLREFQSWLKKKDPSFGDLRKVLNKQNQFLWVHRDYENQY